MPWDQDTVVPWELWLSHLRMMTIMDGEFPSNTVSELALASVSQCLVGVPATDYLFMSYRWFQSFWMFSIHIWVSVSFEAKVTSLEECLVFSGLSWWWWDILLDERRLWVISPWTFVSLAIMMFRLSRAVGLQFWRTVLGTSSLSGSLSFDANALDVKVSSRSLVNDMSWKSDFLKVFRGLQPFRDLNTK